MELQKQFAAGDLEAFETLFRQFQGGVFGWIFRIVRDRGAAEDLTVETFWRIYRERFDPSGNFGAWARRIATNAALDHLKKRRREFALPENLPEPPHADPAVRRETQEKLRRAFHRLPPTLHATATLALIEEARHEEIAAAMDISVGNVKTRVFRAVRLLRKELRRLGVEP